MDNELALLLAKRSDKQTNHILHLFLSVVTGGFWLPVWLVVAHFNQKAQQKIDKQVQEWTKK